MGYLFEKLPTLFSSFQIFSFTTLAIILYTDFQLSIVNRSWNKRKTHSWKSLFQRGQRHSNSNTNIKGISISMPTSQEAPATVEDEESGTEGVPNDLPVITSASSSNNSSFKENKLTKSEYQLNYFLKNY